MPLTIKSAVINYKDPDTGDYVEVNAVGDTAHVTDVQVNGTSIVADNVANIPIGSSDNAGVVKSGVGIGITNDGRTYLINASSANVKSGTIDTKPIAPINQHESVFYGLAKLAGVDMKDSSNPVGEFTDEAKIAIQKMLGIYEPPFELVNDITLTERTSIDLSADSNGKPYNFLSVIMEIYYVANLTTESSGYGRYLFYDSNNISVVAETGKYVANTNPNYKDIYIERKGNCTLARYTRQANAGAYGNWLSKAIKIEGMKFNMGNIVRIALNSADFEPAGTNIKIYAQWAY